jgi:NUMOD3 motif
MDYNLLYERLIMHARLHPPIDYSEEHHIIPRCIGGSDDKCNIVSLTARQHFVAHLILAKIFRGAYGGKLVAAIRLMSGNRRYTSRRYAWVKRLSSETQTITNAGNKYNMGKRRSLETRLRISRALKGLKRSDETKRRIGLSSKGRVNYNKGIKLTGHRLECARKARVGRRSSMEIRQRISNSLRGERNPFFGRRHSEEARRKMRAAATGRVKPHKERRDISNRMIGNKFGCAARWSADRRDDQSQKWKGENNPRWRKGLHLEKGDSECQLRFL